MAQKMKVINVKVLNFCNTTMRIVKTTLYTAIVIALVLLFVTMDSHFVSEIRPVWRTEICNILSMEDKEAMEPEKDFRLPGFMSGWFE